MKPSRWIGIGRLLLAIILLPASARSDSFDDTISNTVNEREKALRENFEQFPLLKLKLSDRGKPRFQTLDLDTHVTAAGIDYYGFRFTVPDRKAKEDFVWAFIQNGHASWYILPEEGPTDGFIEYLRDGKSNYTGLGDDLFPHNAKYIVLQDLHADALVDGKTYLIWFAFDTHKPAKISLEFMFTNMTGKDVTRAKTMAAMLGLHRRALANSLEAESRKAH